MPLLPLNTTSVSPLLTFYTKPEAFREFQYESTPGYTIYRMFGHHHFGLFAPESFYGIDARFRDTHARTINTARLIDQWFHRLPGNLFLLLFTAFRNSYLYTCRAGLPIYALSHARRKIGSENNMYVLPASQAYGGMLDIPRHIFTCNPIQNSSSGATWDPSIKSLHACVVVDNIRHMEPRFTFWIFSTFYRLPKNPTWQNVIVSWSALREINFKWCV